ncbi:MAG: alpha-amylase family glycosyl hydrolase [Acidobacteriota bacterium]|nr:alpha-amylase family glycosyl hydrolase [Acidobacteriota bacterium]
MIRLYLRSPRRSLVAVLTVLLAGTACQSPRAVEARTVQTPPPSTTAEEGERIEPDWSVVKKPQTRAEAAALEAEAAESEAAASEAESMQAKTVKDDPVQWDLDWADGAVFYEIFVRSFADSDGDGIGDFPGLTAKLDYLNDGDPETHGDLGVEGIWLMPVFASPSYHGYDVVDYETINPDYGTLEDFQTFLEAAHQRGIRVIVDFMLNHTSAQHPWFVESASSPDSPKRDWYEWSDTDPGWTRPWGDPGTPTWHEKNGAYYYGIFWSGMPDLNFRNPEVREEAKRLAKLWLDRGVDGFRLDAARHLIAAGPGEGQSGSEEGHEYWQEFAAAVREYQPEALLVGENWTDAPTIAEYYGSTESITLGDELPMSFDFPLAEAMVQAAKSGLAAPLVEALAERDELYPPGVLDATFLTNHDMVRIATVLQRDPLALRTAAALLLTLPGTPFIYYGEEIGLANGPVAQGDPAKRTPMPWSGEHGAGFTTGDPWRALAGGWQTTNVEAQTNDPRSLLSHYRRLIQLRSEHPALGSAKLGTGDIQVLETGDPAIFAFVAQAGDSRVVVAHNLGTGTAVTSPFPLETHGLDLRFTSVLGTTARFSQAGWSLELPASASAVWVW